MSCLTNHHPGHHRALDPTPDPAFLVGPISHKTLQTLKHYTHGGPRIWWGTLG